MADNYKKLALKLIISTKEWKDAVKDIKGQLKDLNDQAKRDASAMKASQKDQLALTRQQIADQKRLQQEARTMVSVDQAKAQWEKKNQEAIRTKIQQRILETTELKKQQAQQQAAVRLEQDQLRLAQQRLRLAQQQTKEQEKQNKSTGGGGVLGTLGRGLAGVLGGGPIGMIAAGASIGQATEHVFEMMVEKLREFTLEMKNATGTELQLAEQFTKLAQRAGEDPTKFINQLRVATRGLVDDTQLYRVANNFMQSGVKATGDQISRLTELTVSLARSQGRDATQAVEALVRASLTGRTMILAMTTGLDRQQLALQNVSQHMDENTRKTLEFNRVLQAMEARFKAVGTPATTFIELTQQIGLIQRNVFQDIGQGIAGTLGFQQAIEKTSKALLEAMPRIYAISSAIGNALGNALAKLIPVVKSAWDVLASLYGTLSELYTLLRDGSAITSWTQLFDKAFGTHISKISFFQAEVVGLVTVLQALSYTLKNVTATLVLYGDVTKGIAHASTSEITGAFKQYKKTLEENRKEFLDSLQKAVTDTSKESGQANYGAAGASGKEPPNIGLVQSLIQLDIQKRKEQNNQILEATLDRIDKEKRATQQQYDDGITGLKEYTEKQKVLVGKQLDAKIKEINAERAIDQKTLDLEKAKGTPAIEIASREELLNLQAEGKRKKAKQDSDKQLEDLDRKLFEDQRKATQEHNQNLNSLNLQAVQTREAYLEKEFSQGIVLADAYLQKKRDLLEQENKLTLEGLQQQYDASVKNAEQQEKIAQQIAKVKADYEKQTTLLTLQEDEVRLKSLVSHYNQEKKVLQTELQIAQASSPGVPSAAAETSARGDLIAAATRHLSELEAEQLKIESTTGRTSDAWRQVRQEIAATVLELQKLNHEQAQAKDTSGTLGTIVGGVGRVFGAAGGVRGRGIEEITSATSTALAGISQFGIAANTKDAQGKAIGGKGVFSNIASTFEKLTKPVEVFDKQMQKMVKVPFSDKLSDFSKALGPAVSGLSGLVQGLTSGKTGGQGALSGGLSGLQFGAKFGPIGAAIGGIGGAVMGGIFGAKEKRLQQDIKKIQHQMEGILQSLNSGTITLNQAIQDLRRERKAAIQTLTTGSNSKKGNKSKGGSMSQAQAVIEQIDTEIKKLVDEQKRILDELHTSLIELAQPTQFQEYLQSLDQIINKYQEFASAASGNAQEVANANQYLNESLQNYVQTLSKDLNQAQQQAIQDALTLINLEYQRQQIINSEAQQEYDVLTQGVMVRQRTTAMTKGQEIGHLRYQRDMQLEQINEQIALNKAKVDAESKIFDLANTRIGLENQLLDAQKEQVNYQVAQIAALAQVISGLQKGLSSGQIMQQISSLYTGGVLPTNTGIMSIIAQLLGLGNIPTNITGGPFGSANWLAQVPQPYQSAASYMNAMDSNFYNLLVNALQSSPGSAQRQAVVSDIKQYAGQGKVEGYDMDGLINWILSTSANPGFGQPATTGTGGGGGVIPTRGMNPLSFQSGGEKQGTGLALIHDKEIIVPAPVAKLINGLTGASVNQSGMHNLSVEKHMMDMVSARTDMEMSVVTAKSQLLEMEMMHLDALNATLDKLQSTSLQFSPAASLAGMLQKEYEVRGRYGSATFRRETL